MRYCPECFAPSPDDQARCACGVDLEGRGITFGLPPGEPVPGSPWLTLIGVVSGVYWVTFLREMNRPGHRGGGHELAGALLLIALPMLVISAGGAIAAVVRLREGGGPGAVIGLIGNLVIPLIVIAVFAFQILG
jgi:hypothetical protein